MRKRFRVVTIPSVIFVAVLMLVGCGKASAANSTPVPVTDVKVTLSEFKVEVSTNQIPTGLVRFAIENNGSLVHDLTLEPEGANNEPFVIEGRKSAVTGIEPGQTVTLEWTLDTPGVYQLACHLPGHYEAGMVTTLQVVER